MCVLNKSRVDTIQRDHSRSLPVYAISSPTPQLSGCKISPNNLSNKSPVIIGEDAMPPEMQLVPKDSDDSTVALSKAQARHASNRSRKDLTINTLSDAESNRVLSAAHQKFSKTAIDVHKPSTDLESFDISNTGSKPRFIPKVERGEISEPLGNYTFPCNLYCGFTEIFSAEPASVQTGVKKTTGSGGNARQNRSVIPDVPKPQKRKRADATYYGEEIKSETETVPETRQPYNSQLLQPRETATTRSTTKYKARGKKNSHSPSRIADTDFDTIPNAAPSPVSRLKGIPPIIVDQACESSKTLADNTSSDVKKAKMGRVNENKAKEKTIKSKKSQDGSLAVRRTKVCYRGPVTLSTTSLRRQRMTKKPRRYESDNEGEDPGKPETATLASHKIHMNVRVTIRWRERILKYLYVGLNGC